MRGFYFGFGMYLQITLVLTVFLSILSIDIVNALNFPQCGEFVFPQEDTKLSTEEIQFKQTLPFLFESFDSGNYSGIERYLKSLEKYRNPLAYDNKNLEQQRLPPLLEIVSHDKHFSS